MRAFVTRRLEPRLWRDVVFSYAIEVHRHEIPNQRDEQREAQSHCAAERHSREMQGQHRNAESPATRRRGRARVEHRLVRRTRQQRMEQAVRAFEAQIQQLLQDVPARRNCKK